MDADSARDLVIAQFGGTEEEWKHTHSEVTGTFDGKEMVGAGGAWGTKTISADQMGRHQQTLEAFRSGQADLLEYENGDELHVTVTWLDADGETIMSESFMREAKEPTEELPPEEKETETPPAETEDLATGVETSETEESRFDSLFAKDEVPEEPQIIDMTAAIAAELSAELAMAEAEVTANAAAIETTAANQEVSDREAQEAALTTAAAEAEAAALAAQAAGNATTAPAVAASTDTQSQSEVAAEAATALETALTTTEPATAVQEIVVAPDVNAAEESIVEIEEVADTVAEIVQTIKEEPARPVAADTTETREDEVPVIENEGVVAAEFSRIEMQTGAEEVAEVSEVKAQAANDAHVAQTAKATSSVAPMPADFKIKAERSAEQAASDTSKARAGDSGPDATQQETHSTTTANQVEVEAPAAISFDAKGPETPDNSPTGGPSTEPPSAPEARRPDEEPVPPAKDEIVETIPVSEKAEPVVTETPRTSEAIFVEAPATAPSVESFRQHNENKVDVRAAETEPAPALTGNQIVLRAYGVPPKFFEVAKLKNGASATPADVDTAASELPFVETTDDEWPGFAVRRYQKAA